MNSAFLFYSLSLLEKTISFFFFIFGEQLLFRGKFPIMWLTDTFNVITLQKSSVNIFCLFLEKVLGEFIPLKVQKAFRSRKLNRLETESRVLSSPVLAPAFWSSTVIRKSKHRTAAPG